MKKIAMLLAAALLLCAMAAAETVEMSDAFLTLPEGFVPVSQADMEGYREAAARDAGGRDAGEALLARRESVPVSESAGRVCAEAAVSCPPAIPVAVCGERITPEAAQLMEELGIGSVSVVQGLE